jgi:TM2 domain-containing membrane protein YozV
MAKIVLSYRRNDSAGVTGRIWDHLCQRYGQREVFMDVDSIPVGVNFREYFASVLDAAKLLVVVIGPHWAGSRRGAASRLHNEDDEIRIEIELAKKLHVPILPVLVDGATMPNQEDVPESLSGALKVNAAFVEGRTFLEDIGRLKLAIDRCLKESRGHEDLNDAQRLYFDVQMARQQKTARLAIVLALCLGWIGVHRFYIGETGRGFLTLAIFGVSAPFVEVPFVDILAIPVVLALYVWALFDCFRMPGEVRRCNDELARRLWVQARAIPVPVVR